MQASKRMLHPLAPDLVIIIAAGAMTLQNQQGLSPLQEKPPGEPLQAATQQLRHLQDVSLQIRSIADLHHQPFFQRLSQNCKQIQLKKRSGLPDRFIHAPKFRDKQPNRRVNPKSSSVIIAKDETEFAHSPMLETILSEDALVTYTCDREYTLGISSQGKYQRANTASCISETVTTYHSELFDPGNLVAKPNVDCALNHLLQEFSSQKDFSDTCKSLDIKASAILLLFVLSALLLKTSLKEESTLLDQIYRSKFFNCQVYLAASPRLFFREFNCRSNTQSYSIDILTTSAKNTFQDSDFLDNPTVFGLQYSKSIDSLCSHHGEQSPVHMSV